MALSGKMHFLVVSLYVLSAAAATTTVKTTTTKTATTKTATTQAPTTRMPTTKAKTTKVKTTLAPTTLAPTTMPPTTAAPTTQATGTTTGTEAHAKFFGEVTLTIPGANKTLVESVTKEALSAAFNISSSKISVDAKESRRLDATSSLRRLAGTWRISYEFYVAPAQVAAVDAALAASTAHPTALLLPHLKKAMVNAGVSQATVDATAVVGFSSTKMQGGTTKSPDATTSAAFSATLQGALVTMAVVGFFF